MPSPNPFSFSLIDVRSYLPAGWNLVDPDDAGRWDAQAGGWILRVHDGADTPWTVLVRATDVQRHGRLPALREALDHVYRTGIGRDNLFG